MVNNHIVLFFRISWATTSSTKMNPRKSTASPSEISTSPAPFLPYQPKTDSESSISSPHPSLNKPTRSPITQQSDENIPTVQILFSFLSNQVLPCNLSKAHFEHRTYFPSIFNID